MESRVYTAPVGLLGVLDDDHARLGVDGLLDRVQVELEGPRPVGTSTTLQWYACTHMRYPA